MFGDIYWKMHEIEAWRWARTQAAVDLAAKQGYPYLEDPRPFKAPEGEPCLLDALRRGQIHAVGRLNGQGEKLEISPLAWADLELNFTTGVAGTRTAGAAYYSDLFVDRQEVLGVWRGDEGLMGHVSGLVAGKLKFVRAREEATRLIEAGQEPRPGKRVDFYKLVAGRVPCDHTTVRKAIKDLMPPKESGRSRKGGKIP